MFNAAIAGIFKGRDKQLKERLTELGIKQITGAEEESKQDMNNNITIIRKEFSKKLNDMVENSNEEEIQNLWNAITVAIQEMNSDFQAINQSETLEQYKNTPFYEQLRKNTELSDDYQDKSL